MKGLIVKGIGGFYYIQTEAGLIEAKGRGIFKKQGITLCVGDEVEVTLLDDTGGKGVIEEIYPRKNHFIRPPIANIDIKVYGKTKLTGRIFIPTRAVKATQIRVPVE